MEGLNQMRIFLRTLDRISLYPHLSAGMSIRNKKTGKCTGPRSISLSFCVSLLRFLIVMASIMLALKMLFCMLRWKREKKIRDKYRKKWKRQRKKMSKS